MAGVEHTPGTFEDYRGRQAERRLRAETEPKVRTLHCFVCGKARTGFFAGPGIACREHFD